jgi:translation initiation factor 3 subunit A
VLKLSPAPIKALYNLLEVAFDPLSLCASIAPIMHQLASDTSYAPYLPLLQRALLSRLLNQLSQVYSSIKIANLMDLVKPLREVEGNGDGVKLEVYTEPQIESYVMGCARRGELCIRVDHAEGSITFIDDPFSSSPPSSSDHERGGGTVQASMAELVRTRLSKLAGCLHGALEAISPPPEEYEGDAEKLTALITAADAERKALQLRRALVARRRELLAELSARKEKEEASRRAEASRREKEDEERRVREEGRRREIERARKDVESIRNAEALKLLERMKGTFKGQLDVSALLLVSRRMKLTTATG